MAVARFASDFLRVPRGHGVRRPLRLRPWQRALIASTWDAKPRPRIAGWMLPRGQGKTSLTAVLALYELLAGAEGAQVVVVATDERQAGLCHRAASRMVELHWELANPALGDFLAVDGLEAVLPPKMREASFRRARLCQLTDQLEDAWLPPSAWAACADATRSIPDGAEVVLAFDGSFNGDCTVLVVASVDQRPHVDLVELWEPDGRQVPVVDVEHAIRQACRRWRVLEIAADPFRWARSLQLLDGEGLPVLEYPQSPGRMTPATARFYEAVVNGQFTHSGDSRLARHVGNAVLREDARGARLAKERKDSPRRIDAAVAAVMAHDRAAALAGTIRDSIYI